MDNNRSLISVQNVTQEFKVGDQIVRPLKDVSFEIAGNSFNIIYGPSGSGKSTLLNILTGLLLPTKGTVILGGQDICKLSSDDLAKIRASKLGFVYQTNYWVKSLNVLDNVSMPLYFLGKNRVSAAKQAMESLAMVHMEGYAKKNPMMLSGGEQQRIAMARALVTNPDFVIADEPTGSLDSTSGEMIMELLRNLQHTLHRTIILVTHNMEYIPYADQLIHIEDGQVERLSDQSIQDTAEQLLKETESRIERIYTSKKAKSHEAEK